MRTVITAGYFSYLFIIYVSALTVGWATEEHAASKICCF